MHGKLMGETPTSRRWRLHPLLAAASGFLGSLVFLVAGNYIIAVVAEPSALGDLARLRATYRILALESTAFTVVVIVLRLLTWICAGAIASLLASRRPIVAALLSGAPFAIAWIMSLAKRGASFGDYVLVPISLTFAWLGHYGVEWWRERSAPADAG